MQIKLDFSMKNIGYYPMIIDKARMELREKNEEKRKRAASATPALRARGRGNTVDIPECHSGQ